MNICSHGWKCRTPQMVHRDRPGSRKPVVRKTRKALRRGSSQQPLCLPCKGRPVASRGGTAQLTSKDKWIRGYTNGTRKGLQPKTGKSQDLPRFSTGEICHGNVPWKTLGPAPRQKD